MRLRFTLLLAAVGLRTTLAQGPPQPDDINVTTTNFFDHDSKINQPYLPGFQQWLRDNIPFIDIPDPIIEANYYYRFWALAHHMVYTVPGMGYFISEFNPWVGYGGFFGDINAAAGHQIEEAQWLRSTWYSRETTNFWLRAPNKNHQYTHWVHYSASTAANVTGDQDFLNDKLNDMVLLWHEFDYTFNNSNGLYFYTPNWDAQEYSLPNFIAWNATGRSNGSLFDNGPDTYRPTFNAYMVANAKAISNVANAVDNSSIASEFAEYAVNLENAIYQTLWDSDKQFFMDVIDNDYTPAGVVDGREVVGFVPYRFGIGLSEEYLTGPLTALYDPNSFYTEFGPPSLERQNEWYSAVTPPQWIDYTDVWDGQSWPFLTSHLMKSLATIVRSGQSNFTIDQYYEWMGIWTRTQYKNGVPYIAESHFPEAAYWGADGIDHSEHYQHSTGADLIITGFLGITPRSDNVFEVSPLIPSNWTYFAIENLPYHGNLMSVVYDSDGKHYNQQSGLTIYANGKQIYNSATATSAQVQLPANSPASTTRAAPGPSVVNVACNPMGTLSNTYPTISATYSNNNDNPWQAIDGRAYFNENPHNRWTNYHNGDDPVRANDTLTITMARQQPLTSVTLAIFQDTTIDYNATAVPNPGIACPRGIIITDDQGNEIANLPNFLEVCQPNEFNTIPFNKTVTTQSISINFFAQSNLAVGITEIQLWVPATYGPLYLAADASSWVNGVQPGAFMTFDPDNSNATSTGAVYEIADSDANPRIDFSGIYAEAAGEYTLTVRYSNPSGGDTSFDVEVNARDVGEIGLPATTTEENGGYGTASRSVRLERGMNFVTFLGGVKGVRVESIEVKDGIVDYAG